MGSTRGSYQLSAVKQSLLFWCVEGDRILASIRKELIQTTRAIINSGDADLPLSQIPEKHAG